MRVMDGHEATIRVINTPECWWCGVHEQMVIHLYAECRRWRRERRKLNRELGQLRIGWQPRSEREGDLVTCLQTSGQ